MSNFSNLKGSLSAQNTQIFQRLELSAPGAAKLDSDAKSKPESPDVYGPPKAEIPADAIDWTVRGGSSAAQFDFLDHHDDAFAGRFNFDHSEENRPISRLERMHMDPTPAEERQRYQEEVRHNRKALINGVREGLEDTLGEGGARGVELGVGLAYVATGGKVEHTFDTSNFAPRSKLSISANVKGEARIEFKMPLGGR